MDVDRIVCGDALEMLQKLPDQSVDAVITDPPYSSGTRREAAKSLRKSMRRGIEDAKWFDGDQMTVNGFSWLMRSCGLQWRRICKVGGHILVFIDWRMLFYLAPALESADLRNVGLLVWDKTYFGMGTCFRNQHELLVHFTNGKGIDPQRRDMPNVLSIPPVRNGQHPTEKPVDLLRKLILTVVPNDGIVLDPFCGSGTTCIAARQEGRHYLGIELNPDYVEMAEVRIKQECSMERLV